MVEYVLAVTMMWVTPQGQTKGEAFNGVYPTHQACMQAMSDRIDLMKRINGVSPIPTGTELCAEREPAPKLDPKYQALVDKVSNAVRDSYAESDRKAAAEAAKKKPTK